MNTPVALVAATLTAAILLAATLLIATGTRGEGTLPPVHNLQPAPTSPASK
jgi:hypothetical protein